MPQLLAALLAGRSAAPLAQPYETPQRVGRAGARYGGATAGLRAASWSGWPPDGREAPGGAPAPSQRLIAPPQGLAPRQPAEGPAAAAAPPAAGAAPVAADVAPPAVGSLVSQARDRLKADHNSLANVSEELLQVQSAIAAEEQAIFGKVLHLEAIRTMYTQHQQVEAINARLREEVEALTAEVEGLSSQLASAQRGYLTDGQALRAKEARLRASVVESQAMVEGLEFELSRGRDQEATFRALSEERQQLLNESAHASREGEAALQALAEVKAAVHREALNQTALREATVAYHDAGRACHEDAKAASEALEAAQAELPTEEAAAGATLQHEESSKKAAMQRLLAERALLIDQVRKTEDNVAHAFAALKETRLELMTLEQHLVEEIRNITTEMNLTVEHTIEVSRAADENRVRKAEDNRNKFAVQTRLVALQEKLSPVRVASLRAENEAYSSELKHAVSLLERSKAAEALAAATAQQTAAEVEAQQRQVQESAESIQQARIEGRRLLAAAVAEATVGKARANATAQAAGAALEATCNTTWQARQQEVDKALAICNDQRAELSVLVVAKETLQQTLRSQQASMAGPTVTDGVGSVEDGGELAAGPPAGSQRASFLSR